MRSRIAWVQDSAQHCQVEPCVRLAGAGLPGHFPTHNHIGLYVSGVSNTFQIK